MPITVQQFDFIAATQGINQALATAEQAGGITGTRDVPTQIELGTGGSSGLSGTKLSGGGGQYMPGTAVTDTSQGIGEAGTQASGQILGGGGLAEGATSTSGMSLQDLMSMFQGDTSEHLPNAPLAEVMSGGPKAATAAEALMARANAGEILSVSEIASLERNQQMAIAQVVLGNYIAHMQQMGDDGNIEGVNNSFRGIYDLWQNFYEAGGADIDVLMKSIATERGSPGFFDGYEEALRSAGESLGGQMPPTTGTGAFQFKQGAAPLQGTDEEIFSFLAGLYKKQSDQGTSSADILTAMLNEGADMMVDRAGLFGQTFTDRTDAYKFLRDWAYSPTQGNFGATSGWNTFNDAAMAMPPWTGLPSTAVTAATQVTPTVPGQPTPATGGFDMGGLAAYGTPESLRPFGQIYPGFSSLLPGYTSSPAVQSAYQQAGAPLETQYLAQQALTKGGAPGTDVVGSDIQSWLQNVQAGTQPLTMGQDYASFLNQLTGALGSPAGAPVAGMDPTVQMKLTGLFQDPSAQLAAFTNPFYRATAGSPQVRNALMNQIQQAQQRYQYQEPSGAFLPWAMETNVGGIQSILPSLQGWAPPA
jgi:hypothetical protein